MNNTKMLSNVEDFCDRATTVAHLERMKGSMNRLISSTRCNENTRLYERCVLVIQSEIDSRSKR